jgi:hypothetical protein
MHIVRVYPSFVSLRLNSTRERFQRVSIGVNGVPRRTKRKHSFCRCGETINADIWSVLVQFTGILLKASITIYQHYRLIAFPAILPAYKLDP